LLWDFWEGHSLPKLRHYDNEGTARFVTFGCYRSLPFLKCDRAKRLFLEELDRTRHKHGFKLLGYVIMPEHVHLVPHNNPVRRALVNEPAEWRWSSYNCYHGAEDVHLIIDRFDL